MPEMLPWKGGSSLERRARFVTVEEYADAMVRIVSMSEMERLKMAAAARRQARRFSEQRFYDDFKAAVRPILSHTSR